jgi:hypothetical protein
MKAVLPILFLFLFTGCAKDPRHDLKIVNQYKVGASRENLVAELAAIDAKCIETKARPSDGWPIPNKKTSQAERAAYRFEQQNPGTIVQLSELYWVWRHYDYASAFSIPGVWHDFLLFDKDNKLLGHARIFAD